MNGIKTLSLCLVFLACAGCVNNAHDQEARRAAKAAVRELRGDVSYSSDGLVWTPAKPRLKFSRGMAIKTGPDSIVDIQVNGPISALRMMADTSMTLKKMAAFVSGVDSDSETRLDLGRGTLLGKVKKIAGASSYSVSTPRGVTGVRGEGTDFVVQTVAETNGTYEVTFTCVSGVMVCVANESINGQTTPQTVILQSGQSWTPTDFSPGPDYIMSFTRVVGALPETLKLFADNEPGSPIKAPKPATP